MPPKGTRRSRTSQQFTQAFNLFVQIGWQANVSNATKLHFLAYYPVRDAFPELNSNLTNTARAKAAEALRSAFALRQDAYRTVSMPHAAACPPRREDPQGTILKSLDAGTYVFIRALNARLGGAHPRVLDLALQAAATE